MGWILDYYTIFINFGSLLNFGEKIEKFSKIKFREIFSAVNPLEKIQKKEGQSVTIENKNSQRYIGLNVFPFWPKMEFFWKKKGGSFLKDDPYSYNLRTFNVQYDIIFLFVYWVLIVQNGSNKD